MLPGGTKSVSKYTDKRSYSLYMLPNVQLNYKATDFVKLYVGAGAEYRNLPFDTLTQEFHYNKIKERAMNEK